jgi:hypothetical protein
MEIGEGREEMEGEGRGGEEGDGGGGEGVHAACRMYSA